MTPYAPEPSGTSPGADTEARFAAWLDDLAAGVDDPHDGEVCRQILNDEPQEQRALLDFLEALTTARPIPAAMWPQLAAALLVAVAALTAVVVIAVSLT